ncbi:MAG: pentapeptide repeat-containing protein [Synechococcaceae cyanobacterium]|nr:pentapeptide repeat-containing protein [Synechococcaceae cyanobacterium]
MTASAPPSAPTPPEGAPGEPLPPVPPFRASNRLTRLNQSTSLQLLLGTALTLAGLVAGWPWLALPAALITLVVAALHLAPPLWRVLSGRLDDGPTTLVLAVAALLVALVAVPLALGWWDPFLDLYRSGNWEAIGAVGEGVIGAVGQILVALVALAIAWRQVVIDQRLTSQQNRITQAQTIDSFIHGISEMIIDEEGLLEDWPLERMLAEGRLAAVISSVDREGSARILRFLSHARLLTPLRRDLRLGRAILDGEGNYEEDRLHGVPVIRLQRILKGIDLSGTDLRGVDFNGADLRGADLSRADLREANLAGANLGGANLEQARLDGALFFFGRAHTATPRGTPGPVDHAGGNGTGAIVENANFSGVRHLDPQAHHYLASWSGQRSRHTLPGSCRGIANQLERRPTGAP